NTLFFYVNARFIHFGGWINGQRNYNPWNITINNGAAFPIEERYVLSAREDGVGSGETVSMNWNEKIYGQGKLTFRPFSDIRLNYTYVLDDVEYRDYDHSFAYNPDGDYKRFRTGHTNLLSLTHTLSANTFYTASLSYFFKRYQQYVYENPFDERYTNDILLNQQPAEVPSFKTGGTQAGHFKRLTST